MRDDLSFHESTILNATQNANTLTLYIEGAVSNSGTHNAVVRGVGVRAITRDHVPIEKFSMEFEDAEILTLNFTSTSLHLIVIWSDFKTRRSATRSYQIECNKVDVQLEDGMPVPSSENRILS